MDEMQTASDTGTLVFTGVGTVVLGWLAWWLKSRRKIHIETSDGKQMQDKIDDLKAALATQIENANREIHALTLKHENDLTKERLKREASEEAARYAREKADASNERLLTKMEELLDVQKQTATPD